ncbi:MAG: hypothetical protein AAGB93_19355, partial [Planctomycetota bacterium]
MKVLALAAVAALFPWGPARANGAVLAATVQAERSSEGQDAAEKATAWPTADDEAAVKRSVSKLRKARNE